MKKYILLFLCLIANCNLTQSQEKLTNRQQDSIDFNDKIYKTIYQIKLCDSPLSIELIEKLNGDFVGNINIILRRTFENKVENFVGKLSIKNLEVKKLISKFKKLGIENIKNCSENNDCIYGLDGVDTEFKIKANGVTREYDFWELISNQKNEKETPENRKKAQKILDFLDNELNLKLKNHELRNKLPKGRYSRWNGNGITVFTIE